MITLPIWMALSLVLDLKAVEAEHSKDSSSSTTTVKVASNKLAIDHAQRGSGGRGAQLFSKHEKPLEAAELAEVKKLLDQSGLLTAKSVDEPLGGPGLDYTFDLDVTIDGRRKQLHLHGPVSNWGGNGKPAAPPFTRRPEYTAAVELVRALEALAAR